MVAGLFLDVSHEASNLWHWRPHLLLGNPATLAAPEPRLGYAQIVPAGLNQEG